MEPPHIPGLTDWRPLARGGFAVVWEARQQTLDRLVAVKVDHRRLDVEAARLRFLREAGAAGQMSAHPGIITVHDAGILADDRPFLVMDLCPGGSLTQYLSGGARPSEERVRDIGVQIADALAATHARGVLHRDVKPANILIDAYDRVGLADFGLAALPGPVDAPSERVQGLTPAYTAPEILRRQPPTPASDVFSLAATLYALLAGMPPRWPGGTPTLAEVVAAQSQPVRPVPGVDPNLMGLITEALDFDPNARPTAAEFRDRLAALPLPSPPGREPSDGMVAPADTGSAGVGEPRRPRRKALLLPVVGLLLVGLLVAALVADRRAGVGNPDGTAGPAPTPTAADGSTPSPSPTASTSVSAPATPSPSRSASAEAGVPDGYRDCSATLGASGYCPEEPECWAGVISVFDLPSLGTARACDEGHVYQTFAAGLLEVEVRRQSQLEDDPSVVRICSADVLESLLSRPDRRTDWEVLVLPPQEADGSDRVYRCLFGRGDRDRPVELRRR